MAAITAIFGAIIAAIGSLPVWAIVLIVVAVVGGIGLAGLAGLALVAGAAFVVIGIPAAGGIALLINYLVGGPPVIQIALDWIMNLLGMT